MSLYPTRTRPRSQCPLVLKIATQTQDTEIQKEKQQGASTFNNKQIPTVRTVRSEKMGRAARLALLAAASTLAAAGPATLVAAFNIPTTGAILRSSTRPTTPTCHQCRRAAQSPLSTASATSTFFVPGSDRRHVRATIGIAPATALGEGGVRGKRQAFFSAKTATTRMLMGETESASAWTGKQRSSLSSTGKTTLGGGFREGGGSAGARSQRTALGATATRQLRFLEDGKPVVVTHDDGQRKWNKCNEFVELGTSGLMVSKVRNVLSAEQEKWKSHVCRALY